MGFELGILGKQAGLLPIEQSFVSAILHKMEFKIATINLCLGLQNKKNLIKETILNEKINLLCMQETELNQNLDHNLLLFPGFSIET